MELLTRTEHWNITYRHALGEVASYFFTQIRDHAKIYGRRCVNSGKVLVPPRAFSDETLEPTRDWVEVGPGGRIEAFTLVYEPFQNLPDPPYAFGYVTLDGADTAIGGYFRGIDLTDPKQAAERLGIGTRVVARFAEERKGDVLDFWFEVAGSIVGEWRLIETKAVDDDGNPAPPPYGPRPQGLVSFSADGRMMCVLCDGRPVMPDQPAGREHNSYCGAYTFDGRTLVTRVDGATQPERVGGDQVRRVEFRGERMVLFPSPRPMGGINQHRELVWERIA